MFIFALVSHQRQCNDKFFFSYI